MKNLLISHNKITSHLLEYPLSLSVISKALRKLGFILNQLDMKIFKTVYLLRTMQAQKFIYYIELLVFLSIKKVLQILEKK